MIIGLDIGATHIRILARDGNKVWGEKIHTPKTLSQFKKTLVGLITGLAAGRVVSGIGVGIAGYLTATKITSSPNMKFLNGFRLPEFLKKQFHLPVVMDNDAACFLRAETIFGQARNYSSSLGITVGTGLGGALYKNKKIIKGENLPGGEIGHRQFKDKELEDYASAKFLNKTGNYQGLGDNLANGLADIILSLKPQILILGGGVMANPRARETISELKRQLKSRLKNRAPAVKVRTSSRRTLRPPVVVVSRFGEFAGALGATLLFKNRQAP